LDPKVLRSLGRASATATRADALRPALRQALDASLPKRKLVQTCERIRLLDEETIAQIAAGEVIERPVSVVKELVENSLDAGATWIRVEVVDGGRTHIVVRDDGRGIAPDDLPLALARHATSKLTTASDLFAIRTLGFRGEGLASIAAAAGSLEIVSRPPGHDFGARLTVRRGALGTVQKAAASPGTTVTVRDLFAATPVRRDFLAGDRSEFSRISSYLSRLALGWPRVSFSLVNAGHEVWSLPAAASPLDRVELVFGRGSRGALAPVVGVPNMIAGVGGFTSRVGADRPNRQGMVVFVNGRLVRSAAVCTAWEVAYADKLPSGRHPFGVLLLSLAPGDVDVNVHPTKIEVRFVGAAAVFEAVRAAVQDALRGSERPSEPIGGVGVDDDQVPVAGGADGRPAVSLFGERDADGASAGAASQIFLSGAAPAHPEPRVVGQIEDTYVVVAGPREVVVIDQHAAHERIVFEELEQALPDALPSVPLLVPRVLELNEDQAQALASVRDELARLGIVIEEFGPNEHRITALPSACSENRFDLMGLLDDLAPFAADGTRDAALAAGGAVVADRRRLILATIACHAVVRAHERLSHEEQRVLYERLLRCRNPLTCPHGRPTMLRLDGQALAKSFRRS
jgi:DNA mismatch repair protein MutL